jgi:hypothetical protein
MKRPRLPPILLWYGACNFHGETRSEVDDSRLWRATARRLALRLNCGRWLESALPVWTVTSIVAACALLILRNRGAVDLMAFGVIVALAWVVGGLMVFLFETRHRLASPDDALVWLEHRLQLNNRLTAASAGVGAWPEPRGDGVELLAWRPTRLLPAPLFSLTLLAAALWIPVSVDRPVPPPVSTPVAWTEMERWLEEVEHTELIDERAVEAWRERVASLESQSPEEWFSHASLEAGDSLRDELASELRALEKSLSDVEASLGTMIELDENTSAETRRLVQRHLGEALDDLELASLPLSREMKRRLMTLAREREVKRMTKEQLEQLRERLRERRYASLPRPDDETYAFLTPGALEGDTASDVSGQGGANRGPASAPIDLADERTELGTTRIEDVMGHEPLGTELGETVSVGIGEHDIDTSEFRFGGNAGAIAAPGEGGALVWSQTLTPEERRVLEKYFK